MNKKILAFLMSILICAACIVPVAAIVDDTAEPASDAEPVSAVEEESIPQNEEVSSELVIFTEPSEDEPNEPSLDISLDDILNSDIVAGIMGSQGFVDLTQIVFDIMANYNKETLEAMGEEKVQQVVQSTFDSVAGTITQVYENKDLIITYDPLEVIDNLFDTNTASLTTQAPNENADANELVIGDGDVDQDGKVTAADARLILRRAAHLIRFTDEQDKLADVDKDGTVTAVDARIVLRISANLPIEETKEQNNINQTEVVSVK